MRRLAPLLCPVLALAVGTASLAGDASATGPAPEPDDGEVIEDDVDEESDGSDLEKDPRYQKVQRRMVLGAVLGGFGFILTVAAFGTLGVRATCEGQDKPDCARNNGIASLALGVPGLALLGTGGALFGINLKKRNAMRDANSTALVTPMLVRRGGGAAFTLRF